MTNLAVGTSRSSSSRLSVAHGLAQIAVDGNPPQSTSTRRGGPGCDSERRLFGPKVQNALQIAFARAVTRSGPCSGQRRCSQGGNVLWFRWMAEGTSSRRFRGKRHTYPHESRQCWSQQRRSKDGELTLRHRRPSSPMRSCLPGKLGGAA